METLNNLAIGWWNWMVPMFIQVSLLIIIISLVDHLIQKWAWPQIRYGLWLLILIKLMLPPSLTLPSSLISRAMPRVNEKINHKYGETAFSRTMDFAVFYEKENVPTKQEIIQNNTSNQSDTKTPADNTKGQLVWQFYVMLFHIIGIIFFLIIILVKIGKLRKWHKQQVKKEEIPEWFYRIMVKTANRIKMDKVPNVVFSGQTVSPAVYGIFNPILLLPASYFDTLTEKEAEHVLLHEMAHIKRGDLYLHGLSMGLQIIYWFNPLLIWVTRQMKHVRELCCDTTVANQLKEETPQYRLTLLKTARELLTESLEPGLALLGVFEEPFKLVSRLNWLEKKIWGKNKKMILSALLVSLLFGFSFLPMASPDLKTLTIYIPEESMVKDTGNQKEKLKENKSAWAKNNAMMADEKATLIKKHSKKMNRLLMDEQYDSLLTYYDKDMLSLPNYGPAVRGIENIKKQYEKKLKN